MHAGSPCLSSVAKRTRSQWEIFYRNWHNEVKKEEASEAGVGDNEGSYSLNPENNEISKKRGVKRTGESVDGKNADSVGGGSRGKKKSGKKIDSVDDQIIGSCSKSGPISNVGCDAFKKCGFSDVDETAQGRGRPRVAPSNEGMHVSIDASVDLGKSVLFVDSEDSEKSMDLESSDTANSNSDDSGMLESNSSSEEENDNSDKDISSAPGNSDVSDTANSNSDDSGMLESKSSSEEDSDKDFQVNISSISGDSDVSSFCSDDACCDGSPIEIKIDSEEKERTFVHQEEKCINVGNSKIINEERDGEMAGSKRNYEQYSDYGCMDNPQEVGDGTMKSSKEENEDLNKSGLKKRKFSGIQNLADRNEEHDKEQTSMTGCLRPCMISRPQKKNLNSHSENEESKSQTKDSCNTKCVQRTDQKGRRKVWTPRTKNLDSIKMLINSIEKEAQEPVKKHTSVDINAMNPKSLPFKFRFEDEEPSPPEKSEWEKEIDSLFCDLDMGLRESEFGCKNSSTSNDDDDIIPQDIDCTPAARCSRGEHDPVLDDQIGIKCRYCSAVILEIEDILPPFYTPSSGRQDRKYFYESHSCIFNENQFQDSACGNPSSSSIHEGDTVWDLIRGTKSKLYPHQREGFEFMWRNIAGDIFIEKLRRQFSEDGKGCIISHAPGTGKTRLTIVFLQSFMKLYPTCRPVIIAPRGMLLTWEDEFRKWNVAIPFHNLNSLELSAEENAVSPEIISQVGCHGRSQEYIRLIKFSSWVKGSSILGVSYQLFEKLVGEHRKKGEHDQIWKLLLKLPDLLVLDEGHTPRNHQSRMWKALTKVATNRRIILSGTPFQNNFRELYNTLCLVNPKLMDKIDKISRSCKKGWREINGSRGKWTTSSKSIDKTMDDESTKLRTMIDPFVHVHKGSILQESLPGLRDSLVFLRPTELQKSLLEIASKAKPFFHEVCLVSLISVHPSLVAKDEMFSAFKSEVQRIESTIDAGVKSKFVIKLIWLADALGERVLVFSTFINPLIFIKQQLEHHFSWKEGREVLYMDGQLEEHQRQNSICSFNDFSSEAKVLLASTRACSEGINLIGASRVVLLDTAWNPSVERQAISRAYRLGQKRVVHVYHLITSGTMEFRKYALQAQKDRISQLIFFPTDGPPTCDSETSNIVAEDRVFEALVEDKSFSHIFEKIIHQPKASDLIETFDFVDHNSQVVTPS
ncbi:SNF2 domain-containing protein CLASSY 4-like [Olea europaea var. sylvestris]|uniref:SNF2 domain-containing protein CLASSY 4-like n=1 Tax=Olea europaea var. sylvestris TaxID=158386 RepID=UPI000C1D3361|nr:SNF2 domain-containing protein CLASSY 4-like [Olea europaea var. sylvestris]